MKVISAEQVHAALSYPALIDALGEAYAGEFKMPPRQVFLLDDDEANHDAFAVLPSWGGEFIGVKAFTYFPTAKAPYKSLYSQILLFDRAHGEPLALVDGTSVTFWRTAGISGLATRLLSRENSETMLVLGTGNLASYIIRANASVRPLKKIMVWGRSREKAEAVCAAARVELPEIEFAAIEDREAACAESDIVGRCHRIARTGGARRLDQTRDPHRFHRQPPRDQARVRHGLITKSRVYVDSYVNAMKEAGEILVPISEGVFKREDIVAELAEMCNESATLRQSDEEITLFKSIGMAMSDLVGAGLVYKTAGD